jgi:type VI secretion system protein ImpK
MAYALVALLDEVALTRPEPYRQFWMTNLLQLHYFNENVAGDGFFNRLNAIRKDPHRSEVLQVYYLCMLFGFQGRYRIRGGELELLTLIDQVQKDLERAKPFDYDVLSPHGERPTESLLEGKRKVSPMVFSLGALALALLVYGGLQLHLNNTVDDLMNGIRLHMATNTGEKQ